MITGKIFFILVGTTVLLLFSELFSCNGNPEIEPEIEPVMTLYDKPLSTIQKVIEGRWQEYASYGGIAGIYYPKNQFVEFSEEQYRIEYENGHRDTLYITWKKLAITSSNDPLKGYTTYIMWDKERNDEIWYFRSITNDTLSINIPNVPPSARDYIYGHDFVRVK
jgi:hypothetical protein